MKEVTLHTKNRIIPMTHADIALLSSSDPDNLTPYRHNPRIVVRKEYVIYDHPDMRKVEAVFSMIRTSIILGEGHYFLHEDGTLTPTNPEGLYEKGGFKKGVWIPTL